MFTSAIAAEIIQQEVRTSTKVANTIAAYRAALPKPNTKGTYNVNGKVMSMLEGEEKKSALTNCHFTTISSQISAIYINIFYKTEVQAVILRC